MEERRAIIVGCTSFFRDELFELINSGEIKVEFVEEKEFNLDELNLITLHDLDEGINKQPNYHQQKKNLRFLNKRKKR